MHEDRSWPDVFAERSVNPKVSSKSKLQSKSGMYIHVLSVFSSEKHPTFRAFSRRMSNVFGKGIME
ncbi:hypothetical protein Ccrd_024645 [Cynara cardunculus var. scolymus]|uniref:Uncharacterized protein n=1 Tax=Cynara cardunculus var. scolymus TaxID=59895 RepID=A0A118JSF2_CYNCS|nr:hypothetical protein Ccrd_024645 [Cynara cardunculus var. scolymus]